MIICLNFYLHKRLRKICLHASMQTCWRSQIGSTPFAVSLGSISPTLFWNGQPSSPTSASSSQITMKNPAHHHVHLRPLPRWAPDENRDFFLTVATRSDCTPSITIPLYSTIILYNAYPNIYIILQLIELKRKINFWFDMIWFDILKCAFASLSTVNGIPWTAGHIWD